MSLNVENCPRCGKIYAKVMKELCPACIKEIENQYDECSKYLRSNRSTNLVGLSEATGVPVKQITKFIKEGRIQLSGLPNMGYECDVCGSDIREGNMCGSCRARLAKDISNAKEDEARKMTNAAQENHVSYKIKDRLSDRR